MVTVVEVVAAQDTWWLEFHGGEPMQHTEGRMLKHMYFRDS